MNIVKTIYHLIQERGITLEQISIITQEEINNSPGKNNFGYSKVSEHFLDELLKDNETLFPIELCSLIRRAINLRCQVKYLASHSCLNR